MKPLLIVVTGNPATGKTTLAHQLAEKLKLPVFSKDEMKERLFDVLGWSDSNWSKKLSLASYKIMDQILQELLRTGPGIIIESNFLAEYDSKRIAKAIETFNAKAVQILLYTNEDVRCKRFSDRTASGNRHPGHHNLDEAQKSLTEIRRSPLDINAPLLEIDTTDFASVNLDEIVERIRGEEPQLDR